jgi:hypothetical protein
MERVTNRLALEWMELKPAYRLRELAGSPPPRTIDQRQQQLMDLYQWMVRTGFVSRHAATDR